MSARQAKKARRRMTRNAQMYGLIRSPEAMQVNGMVPVISVRDEGILLIAYRRPNGTRMGVLLNLNALDKKTSFETAVIQAKAAIALAQ